MKFFHGKTKFVCNIIAPFIHKLLKRCCPFWTVETNDKLVFEQLSFQAWLKHTDIRLLYGGARIVNGDLRKFCEQQSDILRWDQSNKNYVLTHGVRGVDWCFYKSPRPEPVYDIYMQYWAPVSFDS